jgi:hypothetical protein|tara:strand:+ start:49 stop:837 length:789 start_codon:yes stop_codon:yes gene_type:complete
MANAIKKNDGKATNVVAFDASMFEQDANKGLGNLGMDDLAIPFLRILSDTSPQIKKRDPLYIEGAESGMIYNTLTKEIYDGEMGARVIPCAYQRQYIEWTDRGEGSGAPVNIYPAESDIISKTTRDDQRKDRLPNGNYIEDTANHYCLVIGADGTSSQVLVAMKSTQRKKSKRWNSLMLGLKMKGANGQFTPPSYSHVYNLKTVAESNNLGNWFGWDITRVGPVEEVDMYQAAKTFADSVAKGEVKIKHEDENVDSGEEAPY